MADSYMKLNPDSKIFTWIRRNPIKQGRLDLFLISETLLNNLKTQLQIRPLNDFY